MRGIPQKKRDEILASTDKNAQGSSLREIHALKRQIRRAMV